MPFDFGDTIQRGCGERCEKIGQLWHGSIGDSIFRKICFRPLFYELLKGREVKVIIFVNLQSC
jgi:hypothetical protein